MPDYGLLSTGFSPKTLEIVRTEINEALQTAFGPSIDVSDGSALGQLVGILAEKYAELWELAEAVNSSQDPDLATNTGLDALAALTGTTRDPAAPSTATLTLTGTPTTVVPAGSRASVVTTEAEFETTEEATIATLTAWASGTAYVAGDRRTNASRAYECITSGTSAGSGGPTTTDEDITDNTAHWRYMGEGTGAVDVEAEAVETGPTVAVSGSITEIETPVAGWSSVINLEDADLGSDVESDESLRTKRELELEDAGSSPVNAIRAALLAVEGVESVTVFVNDTDTTDGDGIPPHAVEALVLGGEDQDIFDALLDSVAAGIATHGNTDGTAEDDTGISHDVSFTRPDEVDIWVRVDVTKDPDVFPATGSDLIKAAIVAYGDAQTTGKDVVSSAISAQCFQVAGVLDVTVSYIRTSSPPIASTTITIDLRELAVFDTSRITVNLSNGTP